MAIFTFNNPSGSSYFTLETVTTSSFYDASSLKNTLGVYSNFVNLSRDGLVTSSYISSVVVPNGTGSFTFDPTFSVFGTSSVYIRGTGEFTTTVSTYSGSFTLTPTQMYGAGILNTFALTPIPAFQARVSADGGSYEAFECQNNVFANTPVNILQTASLLLTPNAGKTSKLYSILPENGNGDFTVTRATTATRVNSAGLVELVPYNLITWSQDFSNANWSKTISSITYNQPDPFGGNNAALCTFTNVSTSRIDQNLSIIAGNTYTLSAWIKGVDITDFRFIFGSSQAVFVTSQIVNGEWVRVSATVTATTTGTYAQAIARTANTNGESFYIYGAQLVEGSTALPYQKTETRLNIPRLDYSLGSCPNLLLEPQRTNIALYSEEFDSATWTKTALTVTENTTISPSGIQDADTILGNGTSSSRGVSQIISVTSGTTYSTSFYVKKNTNNFVQILFSGAIFSTNAWANFDLNSGVLGSIGSAATASIESVVDGWYRCTIVATATATSSNSLFLNLVTSATSIRNESNTLSTSVYLWGAQLEAVAYATSYIPTTTASVTRNADQVFNTSASSLIGQTEGTIFIYFTLLPNNDNNSYLFAVSDGTQANLIRSEIFVVSPTLSRFRTGITTLGTSQVDTFTNIAQFNNKMAISYKLNDVKIFLNGVLIASDTSATIPATSGVYLGSRNNVGNFIGSYYKSFMLFPTPLTDDQLELLTGDSFNTYAEMASYYNYITQ